MAIDYLFDLISNAQLVAFRWLFGAALTAFSISRYRRNWRTFATGKIHIGYELTRFLRPLPPAAMRFAVGMDVPLSLAFMTGVMWPWPALFLCLLSSYVFLLDASRYLNHNYLICLLLALFCVVDAEHLSLVPRWQVLVVQMQFLIVYFYAGVGKLNRDWLTRGEPFRQHLLTLRPVPGPPWFRRRVVLNARIGARIETVARQPGIAITLCWAAAVFDLGIGFALMNPVLRPFVLGPFVAFHLFNQWFYGLGIFPYINYASLVLFIQPEALGFAPPTEMARVDMVAPLLFLGGWFAFQILVPLRRYVFTYLTSRGKVSINSDHHRHFSWTMKLVDIRASGFSLEFFDRRTGHRLGPLALGRYLDAGAIYLCARSPRAVVMALERIEPFLRREVDDNVGIRARGRLSYNGGLEIIPIDPEADLRGVKVRVFSNYPWHFLGDKPVGTRSS